MASSPETARRRPVGGDVKREDESQHTPPQDRDERPVVQLASLDPAKARLYRALWAAEDAKRARDSKGSK